MLLPWLTAGKRNETFCSSQLFTEVLIVNCHLRENGVLGQRQRRSEGYTKRPGRRNWGGMVPGTHLSLPKVFLKQKKTAFSVPALALSGSPPSPSAWGFYAGSFSAAWEHP